MRHIKHLSVLILCILPMALWGNTIVPFGKESPWEMKFVFQENDEGIPPANDSNGKAWYETDYDDSAWGALTGPIQRDDEWELGEGNFYKWENEYGCFYLRRTFTVNLDEVDVDNIFIKYIADDYAEIYINGVEVSRTQYNYEMRAQVPADLLVDGENTLAIYVNDNGGGGAYLDYAIVDVSDDAPFLSPYQDAQGVWYEYNDETESWEITGNDYWINDFVIPATLYDIPVTVIRDNAFGDGICNSITLPEGLLVIGNEAFRFGSLTSLTIPASVNEIGEDIVQGCDFLTSLTVAEGNSWFDSRDDCNAIIFTSEDKLIVSCPATTIPETVTSIGWHAFKGSLMAEITIPAQITMIEDEAFSECGQLVKVTMESEEPIEVDGDPFPDRNNQFLYVPAGCKQAYQETEPWSEFFAIYEEGEEIVYSSVGYVRLTEVDNGYKLTFVYDDQFVTSRLNGETVYSLEEVDGEPEWLNNRVCESVTQVVIDESFADARPTQTHSWFREMPVSSIEGLEYLNTSEVTSMNAMFCQSSNITSLDLSTFDTSNVLETGEMFLCCSGLTELTLPLSLSNLSDNACEGVGSEEAPCMIIVPDDFDFGEATVSASGFLWKGGWFRSSASFLDATVENPLDVTSYFIKNPSFDGNVYTGWSGTSWEHYRPQENAEQYNKNYDIYQDLIGLPEGVYKFSANTFYRAGNVEPAYKNFKAGNEESRYAKLYASTSDNEVETSISSPFSARLTSSLPEGSWLSATDEESNVTYWIPNDMPAADAFFKAGYCNDNEVLIAVTDGHLRIGARKSTTVTGDWSMFDDFALIYYGAGSDAVTFYKNSCLEKLETVDVTGAVYTNDYFSAYEEAIGALQEATTLEEVYAAITACQSAISVLKENLDLWRQLSSLQSLAMETAADTDYLELYRDQCSQWAETDYVALLEARTAPNEELVDEIARVTAMIDEVYHHPSGEDIDMTSLLVNPNFTDYENGWTKEAAFGGNVRADGLEENPCFESWNNANFDIYQIVKNLPKGVYRVSVQGFYRYGRNNYQAYLDGEQYTTKETCPVFIYLNNNITPFTNVYDMKVYDEEFYNYDHEQQALPNGTPIYFPNSMTSSSIAFSTGMYTQSAYGLVYNDGDEIRIGVKGSSNQLGDSWSIWDNFKLTFCGFKADVVRPVLEQAIAEAENELNIAMGSDMATALQDAINEGKAVVDGEDGEAMFNALMQLYDLKEPVSESKAVFVQLVEANNELASAIENAVASDDIVAEANALITSVTEGIANHTYADSDVEGLMEDIITMVHRLGIPQDMASATVANPVECTSIIINPAYDNGDNHGWSGDAVVNASSKNTENYNTNFDYYQELTGLPEGIYRVVVQGFYRAGSYFNDDLSYSADPTADNNALLYAVAGDDVVSKPLKRLASEALVTETLSDGWVYCDEGGKRAVPNTTTAGDEAFRTTNADGTSLLYSGNTVEAKVGSDGKLVIGLKKEALLDYDWTLWDNWQLFYLGKGFVLGDANGDGGVSATDITVAVDYMINGNTEIICLKNADVNEDGEVNVTDITLIVKMILEPSN